MKWIEKLKLAVIERNVSQIETLSVQMVPKFESKAQAQEALALLQEAIQIVDDEKKKTLDTMNKIKKTKAFLSSSYAPK